VSDATNGPGSGSADHLARTIETISYENPEVPDIKSLVMQIRGHTFTHAGHEKYYAVDSSGYSVVYPPSGMRRHQNNKGISPYLNPEENVSDAVDIATSMADVGLLSAGSGDFYQKMADDIEGEAAVALVNDMREREGEHGAEPSPETGAKPSPETRFNLRKWGLATWHNQDQKVMFEEDDVVDWEDSQGVDGVELV
jgi:hypothetical protein